MTHSNKNVFILGTGWLGLPLALKLKEQGYTVWASTSKREKALQLKQHNIRPVILNLDDDSATFSNLSTPDFTIITYPPGAFSTGESDLKEPFINCLMSLNGSRCIYTSSTAVYPARNSEVFESDAKPILSPHSGKVVYELERNIGSYFKHYTVVRLGGLFGPGRNPGRRMQNGIRFPEHPVNLTHLEDAVGAIRQILLKSAFGEVFNVVSPKHPTKLQFYGKVVEQMGGVAQPIASAQEQAFKKVNSDKIQHQLGYRFKYYNPLDALQ